MGINHFPANQQKLKSKLYEPTLVQFHFGNKAKTANLATNNLMSDMCNKVEAALFLVY